MADKTKVTIAVLIAVIVVLASVVIYNFGVKRAISGYVVSKQQEGYDYAIVNIAQIAAQCQPVPLTIGQDEEGNAQIINLVAAECFPERFPELFGQNQSVTS